MVGSIAQNLMMPYAKSWQLMLVLWGLNGYFQSLIWAPSFRIITQSIPAVWRDKSLLLLNIASPAGAVAAYLFSSLVLWAGDWRDVFIWAALCMGIFFFIWLFGSWYIYRNAEDVALDAQETLVREQRGESGSFLRLLIAASGIYLVLPSVIQGMLKDGITNWLPVYMGEVFSLPSQTASAWICFPAGYQYAGRRDRILHHAPDP